jgi:hypothetical protein
MARYTYIALVQAAPGRDEEFHHWYDMQHLPDVLRMPGVVSGRRVKVEWIKANDFDAPGWQSLAIYELDCEDPHATIAAIKAASGTEAMPSSDTMTKVGMLQLFGETISPA